MSAEIITVPVEVIAEVATPVATSSANLMGKGIEILTTNKNALGAVAIGAAAAVAMVKWGFPVIKKAAVATKELINKPKTQLNPEQETPAGETPATE